MSILIDKVKTYENNKCKIKGKWYIAKPLNKLSLKNKLKDCIKLLRNKAIAVHFKEDEVEEGE